MIIISHIRLEDMAVQSNESHQLGVAKKTKDFATAFDMGDLGYAMGVLHDKGKEQKEWQKYIRYVTGFDKSITDTPIGPHHAYVGARIAQIQYPLLSPLIAQPIAGHHRGLYDYCEYIEETKKDIPEGVLIPEPQPCAMPRLSNLKSYDYHHIVLLSRGC